MLSMRLTMNLRCLASQFINTNGFTFFNIRTVTTKGSDTNEAFLYSFDDPEEEEVIKAREAAIEEKRNKSQLHTADYNRQHDRVPYETPVAEHHKTLSYRRKLYGKYGEESNVDPSILWPSPVELAAMKEYEEVAQPFTFQQLVEKARKKKALEQESLKKAEAECLERVSKVKQEIIAFHKRYALQKEKALAQIEHKNKLIEQVRKHFGYKIDPRDEKFKEMLEKLQKEERKKIKADRQAQREEKMKAMLGLGNKEKQTTQEVEGN